MKTIGLLGGMSWVSTEHYYRRLNEQPAHRLGGDSCAALVVWQTDFARITAHQGAVQWVAAGENAREIRRATRLRRQAFLAPRAWLQFHCQPTDRLCGLACW